MCTDAQLIIPFSGEAVDVCVLKAQQLDLYIEGKGSELLSKKKWVGGILILLERREGALFSRVKRSGGGGTQLYF